MRLLSYEYIQQLEVLINNVNELKKKERTVSDSVIKYMDNVAKNTESKSSKFKIALLCGSPLYQEKANGYFPLVYESKFAELFGCVISCVERSKKNISLTVDEFNKNNLLSAVGQAPNILYINTHAEHINESMEIHG